MRIYNVCKELSKDFSLTLLSLCQTEEELQFSVKDQVFSRIERVYLPRWRSFINAGLAFCTGSPLQVSYFNSKEFRNRVHDLVKDHDGVVCHLIRTTPYVDGLNVPKILELTDAISMNYFRVRRLGSKTGFFKRIIYSIEASRAYRYETNIIRRFDMSFLVSEIDRNYLLDGVPDLYTKIMVCSNGVDFVEASYNFTETSSRICFIGNMTTLQNLDAAIYFASEVLPLVLEEIPSACFEIVGRIDDASAQKFAGLDAVRVVGEVEAISTAVSGAAVGVCPMRLGAGVQNKVLEYMALGIPAVVSSLGLEGFDLRDGVELLVADDAQSTARAVVRLLRDRLFAREIASAARKYVEMNHSWQNRLQPMRATLREIMGKQ